MVEKHVGVILPFDKGFFAEQVFYRRLYIFILRDDALGLAVTIIDSKPALGECLCEKTLPAAYTTCETNNALHR